MVIGINREHLVSDTNATGYLKGAMYETTDDTIIFATYSQGLVGKNNGGIITFEGIGEIRGISSTSGADNDFEFKINMLTSNRVESFISVFNETFNPVEFGTGVAFSFRATIGVGIYAVESTEIGNATTEVFFNGNKNLISTNQTFSNVVKTNSTENRVISFSLGYSKPARSGTEIFVRRIIAEYKEIGS